MKSSFFHIFKTFFYINIKTKTKKNLEVKVKVEE